MSATLEPRAAGASDALHALERTLLNASLQWNDSTRQAFDQRYTEPILVSGRKAVDELADLARELGNALSQLNLPG